MSEGGVKGVEDKDREGIGENREDKGEKRGKRWWHEKYKEGKEKVCIKVRREGEGRELKIWRKEGINKVRYRKEKRRYRKFCEGKKEKGRERCMKEEEENKLLWL